MPFEERTYNFSEDYIMQMYEMAEETVVDKIKDYDLSH